MIVIFASNKKNVNYLNVKKINVNNLFVLIVIFKMKNFSNQNV